MTDLRIDTTLLVDTGADLGLVAAEFDAADTCAGQVAELVGAVGEQFEGVDSDLANSLEES